MSGSRQYYQKCVCGSEINLIVNYDFISSGHLEEQFEDWRNEHRHCLSLFHEIQKIKARRLLGAARPVMIESEVGQ